MSSSSDLRPFKVMVDDSHPDIEYRGDWIVEASQPHETFDTQHIALTAGLKARLSFAGVGISVFGLLGPTVFFGQPTTQYSIDGKVVGTHTAPFVPVGNETVYNATFFSIEGLSLGNHTIDIENMNGTRPNTFSLNFFLFDGVLPFPTPSVSAEAKPSDFSESPDSPVTTTPGASARGTGTAVTNATTTALAVSLSPTIYTPQPSATYTSSASSTVPPHAERLNYGAIVGSIVGGGAILAVLVVAFLCLKRRRRLYVSRESDAAPFSSAWDPLVTPSPSPHPSSINCSLTSSAMLSTRAVVALATNFGHRSSTGSSRELVLPGETVKNQSELDTLHPLSRSGSLGLPRPTSFPSTQPTPAGRAPPPISEKSSRLSLPNIHASPPSSPPTSASALVATPPTTPDTGTITPLPPGVWHAPPGSRGSPTFSLFRSLFSNGSRAHLPFSGGPTTPRAADSGLRLYDDTVLPPPYTRD